MRLISRHAMRTLNNAFDEGAVCLDSSLTVGQTRQNEERRDGFKQPRQTITGTSVSLVEYKRQGGMADAQSSLSIGSELFIFG